MNIQRFNELINRYSDGQLSPEETDELMHLLKELEECELTWDDEIHGDLDSFKDEMHYKSIAKLKKYQRKGQFVKLAALILVVLTPLLLIYKSRSTISDFLSPTQMNILATAGEVKEIELKDGTKVWLNSGSTLYYPEEFKSSGPRYVELVGEAFFEVKHSDNQQFVIKSGDLETTVLGTSFNIRSYPDEETGEVTVLSGKVRIETLLQSEIKRAEAIFLEKDQKVVFSKITQKLAKHDTKAADDILWKEGLLKFVGVPLFKVLASLERHYQITIKYNNEIKNCPVFADFKGESPDNVLQILALSLNGRVIKESGHFFLDGKTCE
ncbi:FecR family protein [Parapedobacter deserti]|uniref:FecR family protein n=1 Tax=Parapedobacter deserti TaxID=1912957 RepID=A0ABV7JI09_9SPHI